MPTIPIRFIALRFVAAGELGPTTRDGCVEIESTAFSHLVADDRNRRLGA